MKKKSSRIGWLLILLLTGMILWNLVYGFKLYEIIAALILLEGKKEKIISLSRKHLFFITRANESVDCLIHKMMEFKWQFVAQYGNAFVFTKEGEEIILLRKTFFNRYRVFVLKSVFREEQGI